MCVNVYDNVKCQDNVMPRNSTKCYKLLYEVLLIILWNATSKSTMCSKNISTMFWKIILQCAEKINL